MGQYEGGEGTGTANLQKFKQGLKKDDPTDSKAEVIDVNLEKDAKKKPKKGLVKRLSKTKPAPTTEEVNAKLKKAETTRETNTSKIKEKAKADKEASEMKSKQIPNDT